MDVKKEILLIKRGTEKIIREEELEKKLIKSHKEGKPLKIKWGADPTAPDLHLGHAVILKKLREFQDLGHQVIFLIGDFTATIGDPSGRDEARPVLSEEEVKRNALTYQDQVFKILDRKKTKVVYNSSWLKDMRLKNFLEMASLHTVSRILERDEFQRRLSTGKEIRLTEFLYPLLQAYDSVVLGADVEIGATEQMFNLLMGRTLQRRYGQEGQVVITLPVLEGLDGTRKMSKSFGNYIGLNEPPEEIFGKVMSIPDELMFKYYLLLTSLSEEEVEELERGVKEEKYHPMEIKERLASLIVEELHSCQEAKEAKKIFYARHKPGIRWEERVKGWKPVEVVIPLLEYPKGKIWICRLLSTIGAARSNSEARRLIEQGAVEIEGVRVKDPSSEISLKKGEPFLLRVGKRRIYQVKGEG